MRCVGCEASTAVLFAVSHAGQHPHALRAAVVQHSNVQAGGCGNFRPWNSSRFD